MPRGADPAAEPAPRADPILARGCDACFEWGTVITDKGLHELCPACQTDLRGAEVPSGRPPARRRDQ